MSRSRVNVWAARAGDRGMRVEATGRIELPIGVLQTPALPLGYVAAPEPTGFYPGGLKAAGSVTRPAKIAQPSRSRSQRR